MSRHLDQITIQQFRGLRGLELSKLGRVNLLVGMNNSGKTSVLEAISIFCQSSNPPEWLKTAQRRDARRDVLREATFDSLQWLFPRSNAGQLFEGEVIIFGKGSFAVEKVRAVYKETLGIGRLEKANPLNDTSLEIDEEEIQLDVSRRGADVEITTTVRERPTLFDERPTREFVETFQIWEDEPFIYRKPPSSPTLPTVTITPVSHWVDRFQIRSFSEAILDRRREEVIALVRQIDDRVRDLEIVSRRGIRSNLYVDHEQVGLAPLTVFGDGLRRVLMIALAIQSAKGGVLLIDEVETAIHKSVLGDVFNRIARLCQLYDVQLFVTTHSLEAVDAIIGAESINLRDTVGYRLETAEDKVSVQRYNGDVLHRIRYERGLDVR